MQSERASRLVSASAVLLLSVLIAVGLGAVPAAAQGGGSASAGVQEYYVPGTQAELLALFNKILLDTYGADGLGNPTVCVSDADGLCITTGTQDWENLIESRVSVVAYADRSVLLLDDDANGYVPDADKLDPSKYQGSYDLDRGQVRTFWQTGRLEIPGVPGALTAPFAVKGGDRIVTVGGPVFVMRAAWPKHLGRNYGTSGAPSYSKWSDGQVLADCVALYPTGAWGQQYGSPMGVAGGTLHVDDLITKAVVQARQDGTVVRRNGTIVNNNLAQGRSHVIETVGVGDLIEASAPVQVVLVTSGRKNIDARFYNLTPESLINSDYVIPMNATRSGTDRAMDVRLYLYAHSALNYQVYQGTVLVGSGTLAAGGTTVIALPPAEQPFQASEVPSVAGSGAEDFELSPAIRVTAAPVPGAAEPKLQVLVATDSNAADWDWGTAAVGNEFLLNEYYLPWAPAKGPDWPNPTYRGYGHPLHISPVADQTLIEIDWDPWANNGFEYSRVLDAGEWAMVSDPDGDNSGARIRGVEMGEGTGGQSSSGVPDGAFAIAWGEGILADTNRGYDLGYTILPQKTEFFEPPLLLLEKTVVPHDPQATAVAPGGLFHVTLELTAGTKDIESVRISDTLPTEDFSYVPGTAMVTFADGSSQHIEPVPASGLSLEWDLGYTLPAGKKLVVRFDVLVDEDYDFPLPDTRVNESNAYGKWCPGAGIRCFEFTPEAFDDMTVEFVAQPGIDIEKATNGQDADTPTGPVVPVGSTVAWTYAVTNIGNVALTNVTVTDNRGVTVTCPKATLDKGESMTCTASGTAIAGQYSNVGTAQGHHGNSTVTDSDPSHYFGAQAAIDIEKATNGQDADTPTGPVVPVGSTVNWTYVVKNTGNVPLANVAVTDDKGVAVTCPKTTLAVGESMTCTATGKATAGQYVNVGSVQGFHGDAKVTDTDPSHYFGADPAIDIEKLTNGQDADTPTGPVVPVGSTVNWTYVVKNTGNVSLANLAVTDDKGVAVTCPKTTLAVGESMTCTATGTAVKGQYANIGTASGSHGGGTVTDTDPSHYFGADPKIDIEKLTNGQDADTPTGPVVPVGSAVTWTYVVTNTGNVALTNVAVTDDKGVAVTCPKTNLAVEESMTCTATGTAVKGQYANIGTASGSHGGGTVTDTDPSHYFGADPSIDIEKLTNGQDADTPTGPVVPVGSAVTWTYVVTNTGNVPLTNVTITDDKRGLIGCVEFDGMLAVGEVVTCTAAGTAVKGQYANLGTVTGSYGDAPVTDSDPSHYFGADPSIDIEKLTNGQDADTPTGPVVPVGSAVTWTYVVTNTGNVPLTNVTITDDKLGLIGCVEFDGMLAVGEVVTCTAAGTAVKGQYANLGTVTGSYGDAPVTDSDPSHYFGAAPAIDIEKATNGEDADTPTGPVVAVGSTVTWKFVVKNVGNVRLTGVTITDDKLGPIGCVEFDGTLAVDQVVTCTATGKATEGQYANVGSVQGFHGDNKVTDTDPSHYFGADPAIDIEKLTNDEDADTATGPLVPVGSTVTWKYVVKNTGNVRLTDVKVADDKLGLVSCGEWDGTLAAGQTVTCTQTGVATAGQYVNVGSVQGFYGDNKVSDTDPSHYFGFDPRIDVEKLTNGEDADTPTGPVVEVGSTVTWTYVVTNTGNVALTGVTITDDKLGPVGCGEWDGTLAVGQVVTCTATGTATAGQYSNLGTATGAYGGVVVTDSDPSHYFGEEAGGCTRTQGYWSTHWTDNGKQYDPTWALYHDNGTRKFFEEAPNLDNVNTGLNYIEILRRSAAGGNAYIILAQQFIAAELNKLAGAAVPSEVTATLANAAAMLADNKYEDVRDIPKSKTNDDRARALAWATILDQYNSGLIGPGHCE